MDMNALERNALEDHRDMAFLKARVTELEALVEARRELWKATEDRLQESQAEVANLKEENARLKGGEVALAGLVEMLTWQSNGPLGGVWWHNFSGLTHFDTKELAIADLLSMAKAKAEGR